MKKTLASIVLATGIALGAAGAAEAQYDYNTRQEGPAPIGTTILSYLGLGIGTAFVASGALSGFRKVRPFEDGLIERFGKYRRTAKPGLAYIAPLGIDRMYKVPIQEMRVDVPPQEVITKDKLNAEVDAIVYYRIVDTQKALYGIQNYEAAIPSIAQTTLRSVIGGLSLAETNEKRQAINAQILEQLDRQTETWGIDIIRVELQKIVPPNDVQDSMNKVVIAENKRIAASDLATAVEMEADGARRSEIKKAEGIARSVELQAAANAKAVKLKAEAEAAAIQMVNESAEKYFKGNAQRFRELEVTERALQNNTKYVIPQGTSLVNVLGDGQVIPVQQK